MREEFAPVLRPAAIVALVACILILLLDPPAFGRFGDLLAILAGATAVILIAAWLTVKAIGEEMPDSEYNRLSSRSEELARVALRGGEATEFDILVAEALDELPQEFQEVLAETPILVSDLGTEHGAYGLYVGDTVARGYHPNRIVIFRDTLERDFGHDHDMLRAQVTRTVRHEIAHHLGWDEQGVRDLGL